MLINSVSCVLHHYGVQIFASALHFQTRVVLLSQIIIIVIVIVIVIVIIIIIIVGRIAQSV